KRRRKTHCPMWGILTRIISLQPAWCRPYNVAQFGIRTDSGQNGPFRNFGFQQLQYLCCKNSSDFCRIFSEASVWSVRDKRELAHWDLEKLQISNLEMKNCVL